MLIAISTTGSSEVEIHGENGTIHVSLEILDLQAADLPGSRRRRLNDLRNRLCASPFEIGASVFEPAVLDLVESRGLAKIRPRLDGGNTRVVATLVREVMDLEAQGSIEERLDKALLLILV